MSNFISTKHCLICRRPNETLHWHSSDDNGLIYVYCIGTCQRAYSIYEYTATAGISMGDFLKQKFDIKEAVPNEVQRMEWPASFVPLFDHRAKSGLEYLHNRGLDIDDGFYYDTFRNGIVFPLFYDSVFVGAQIRLIDPSQNPDGRKIDTLTGTRSGLLVYNWDQSHLLPQIKAMVITEGAFDAKSIEQAMMKVYGGILKNPWKCVATSGSGITRHHIEIFKELKESGLRVIVAPDSDKAGIAMYEKLLEADAITHYAFTEDSSKDWNKVAQSMGKEDFAKWFIGRIQSVKRTR